MTIVIDTCRVAVLPGCCSRRESVAGGPKGVYGFDRAGVTL